MGQIKGFGKPVTNSEFSPESEYLIVALIYTHAISWITSFKHPQHVDQRVVRISH